MMQGTIACLDARILSSGSRPALEKRKGPATLDLHAGGDFAPRLAGRDAAWKRSQTASCGCAITPPRNRSEPRIWLVLSEGVMTFIIHASKNGQSVVTVRISPAVAVDKARVLESLGWQVHVTDSAGNQFDPSDFDRLSSLADETA